MRSYSEVIAELKSNMIKCVEGEFYEFDGFPLEEEFDKFFLHAQEYLDRKDLDFKLKDARIYYNTGLLTNALAYNCKDYFLIEIFKGTIYNLFDFYTNKERLFLEDKLLIYKELVEKQDISPSYFQFQFVTLYFFYHEVGHLIQRTQTTPDYLEYLPQQCVKKEDISIRHIREHDADWFAANQIAFHISSFIEKENGIYKVFEITKFAELAIASIYMYFIFESKTQAKIYYEDKCHPHPSIRLIYVIKYVLDTLKSILSESFDENAVLRNAIIISSLLTEKNGDDIVGEYSFQLFKELEEVAIYINKIRNDSLSYPYLCLRYFNQI